MIPIRSFRDIYDAIFRLFNISSSIFSNIKLEVKKTAKQTNYNDLK